MGGAPRPGFSRGGRNPLLAEFGSNYPMSQQQQEDALTSSQRYRHRSYTLQVRFVTA